MNNLYKKLNREVEHVKLTAAERSTMRANIFGAPPASPIRVTQSPYIFLSQKWMVAFASFALVVFAGSSTAFAAQGALPGEPLYALKTKVLEPVKVALATSATQKAAVHVAIAQTRVEEAEALAQKGTLTEATSLALADNFEMNAQRADTIASEVKEADPVAAAEIQTQLEASSAAGSAVLVALAERGGEEQKGSVQNLAVRILARAGNSKSSNLSISNQARGVATLTVAPAADAPQPKALVRTFAAATSQESTTSVDASAAMHVEEVSVTQKHSSTAQQFKEKAQKALDAVRAQYIAASSTLDASTTVAIQSSLAGIDLLIYDGLQASEDMFFDTAVQDFTEALTKALKLQALLKAQTQFDQGIIVPLFKLNSEEDDR